MDESKKQLAENEKLINNQKAMLEELAGNQQKKSKKGASEAMKTSMRLKQEAKEARLQCKLDKTCPELATRTTEGPAECVDGERLNNYIRNEMLHLYVV